MSRRRSTKKGAVLMDVDLRNETPEDVIDRQGVHIGKLNKRASTTEQVYKHRLERLEKERTRLKEQLKVAKATIKDLDDTLRDRENNVKWQTTRADSAQEGEARSIDALRAARQRQDELQALVKVARDLWCGERLVNEGLSQAIASMATSKCACGNVARYINEEGMFCCSLCPLTMLMDSIQTRRVPELLKWAREFIVLMSLPDWALGNWTAKDVFNKIEALVPALKDIIQRHPALEHNGAPRITG